MIVLANNIREFLHLFGIGYTELGFDDLTHLPDEPESAARLRDWLKIEFNIDPPATGFEMVSTAQSRHPNFEHWVTEAQRKRDEFQHKQASLESSRENVSVCSAFPIDAAATAVRNRSAHITR